MEHNEIYTKLMICDLGSKLTFAGSRSKPMKHLNGSKNEIAGKKRLDTIQNHRSNKNIITNICKGLDAIRKLRSNKRIQSPKISWQLEAFKFRSKNKVAGK